MFMYAFGASTFLLSGDQFSSAHTALAHDWGRRRARREWRGPWNMYKTLANVYVYAIWA
jgi:hypothetical protein